MTSSELVFRFPCWILLMTIVALSFSTYASAQLDENSRNFLIDLYQATDGDNWQANGGWLGPEGTECNWARVQCLGSSGDFLLDLKGNRMSGELPDSILDADGLVAFIASDNSISGTLHIDADDLPNLAALYLSKNSISSFEIHPDAAPNLGALRITGSSLTGPFPPGLRGRDALEDLDLSFNNLSGDLPSWLGELQLERLRLAGNNFSGSIIPALDAMITDLDTDGLGSVDALPALLDLRGNGFEGELGTEILSFTHTVPEWIDLCWNFLEVADPDVQAWLVQEHREANFDQCLGHTISDPPLTASGSWFDPDRAGEGFSIMLLDDGQTLVHWFTYAQNIDSPPRQSWLIGNDTLDNFSFEALFMFGPEGGQFGEGLPDAQSFPYDVIGELTFAWTDEQRFESEQEVTDAATLESAKQFIGLRQLTQLAGTTCENQTEYQEFSGAWYNPDRAGEGFIVEVLPDDRVVVYWFTYAPDGSGEHAWLTGDGRFDSAPEQDEFGVEVSLFQTAGTFFGEDFVAEDIQLTPWGTIDLQFVDEDNGHVNWSGPEGFGSGSYELARLAQPLLAECD